MTLEEFEEMIARMARERTSLTALCDYLQHKGRVNKYLREEYFAIQAVAKYKRYTPTEKIEIGNEKQRWDARIAGIDIFEVVQALPEDEYKIRKAIASGKERIFLSASDPNRTDLNKNPLTGPVGLFLLQALHARDQFQFPVAIIEAIKKKQDKNYDDLRSLVVVFDGDYSFEDDRIVLGWIEEIRRQTTRGTFKAIYLFERDRAKVFPLFE